MYRASHLYELSCDTQTMWVNTLGHLSHIIFLVCVLMCDRCSGQMISHILYGHRASHLCVISCVLQDWLVLWITLSTFLGSSYVYVVMRFIKCSLYEALISYQLKIFGLRPQFDDIIILWLTCNMSDLSDSKIPISIIEIYIFDSIDTWE